MEEKKYNFVLPVSTTLNAHFKNNETGKWEDRTYTVEQVVNGHPLRAGQKIRPGDDVRPVLGQGGFGITYLVSYLHKDQNNFFKVYYAVKEFFLKEHCWRDKGSTEMRFSPAAQENVEEGLKEFRAEGERLYRICRGNRNIVKVNETFEANNTVYYVMEYIEGGSLRDVVRTKGSGLSEGVALSYIRPICEAVRFIHEEHGLLHCDIKPDNIMLRLDADGQPREPVLIDFGIAIHFNKKGEATTTHSSIGVSPGYSPQEQYQGLDVIMETHEKARAEGKNEMPPLPFELDVYALGATLYYLVTGVNPDVASFSLEGAMDRRLLSEGVSDRMRKVITSAMRQNPRLRTATVGRFLQGFEERYSLPQGFILKAPSRSYQVMTGLMEENVGYLRYEAVVFTKFLGEGGNTTKTQQYHLYECFDKSSHRRNGDESVTVSNDTSALMTMEVFHELMLRKTGLEIPGEMKDANGAMVCEAFKTNGTEYFVVRHGYKPPVEKAFTKLFAAASKCLHDNKKPVMMTITTACLALVLGGGAYWAYNAYTDYRERENAMKKELSEQLTVAVKNRDRADLNRFAENDSLRALNALAWMAVSDNNLLQAKEFAERVLSISKDNADAAKVMAKISEINKADSLLKMAEAESKIIAAEEKSEKKTQADAELAKAAILAEKERNLAEQKAREKAAKERDTKEKNEPKEKQEQTEKQADKSSGSKSENARLALQYVNGERTEANHAKALSHALKADPDTKAKVIQKLKDMEYLPAYNY